MTSPTITRSNTERGDRTTLQRRAESQLTQHPYQLELSGAPRSLAWPSICANCAEPASERITVRKVFRRPRTPSVRRRGMIRHTIAAAKIPFCATCAERHRDITPRKGFVGNLFSVLLTPLIIPIVGSIVLGVISLRVVLDIDPALPNARLAWGVPALMLFICVWSIVAAWRSTQPGRVDPQSEVTRACDFSDDVSRFLERERRIYAMRNRVFAEALAEANRDCVWTADHDRQSGRRALAVLAVAGAIGAAVWVWVVFGPQ